MSEGILFHPYEPVMEIRGKYLDFGRYETALLGLIFHASGIATMAARCRKVAGSRSIMNFGVRRMHPAIVLMVDRNAYIGGCDGVSVGLGARLVGQKPAGTMPHALILLLGERVEALNVARTLGEDLFAVRLDTPGSRRGDFFRIMEEGTGSQGL
jgi:nicotinate phosphoribosyltransferase